VLPFLCFRFYSIRILILTLPLPRHPPPAHLRLTLKAKHIPQKLLLIDRIVEIAGFLNLLGEFLAEAAVGRRDGIAFVGELDL
jgi:hypothetical protein